MELCNKTIFSMPSPFGISMKVTQFGINPFKQEKAALGLHQSRVSN